MSKAQVDVTQLLRAWRGGDPSALNQAAPLIVNELRRTARRLMQREGRNRTLQPTALVNEIWIRLAGGNFNVDWKDRAHFFGICTHLMRQTLVDFSRKRNAEKRGAEVVFVTPESCEAGGVSGIPELVALDESLERLSRNDQRKGRIFELRFWGGLEIAEIAETLHVSEASVARDWRFIKAFLRKELFASREIRGSHSSETA